MNNKPNRLLQSSVFPLFFLLVIWAVFYFDVTYKLNLHEYGLRPRQWEGLRGILTMPLLHSDLSHIASNTLPLLILGVSLFYFYKEIAYKVFFISYAVCGVLVWLLAQNDNYNSVHIGASGLIYALAGFLFVSGIIRKNKALFGISLLVTFMYGTIIWGVLPSEYQRAIHYLEDGKNISWEGHLFGFLTGVCLAYVYRKVGEQQPTYSWEINNDDDIDDANPYWLEGTEEENKPKEDTQQDAFKNVSDNPFTVNYTYIPKKDTE